MALIEFVSVTNNDSDKNIGTVRVSHDGKSKCFKFPPTASEMYLTARIKREIYMMSDIYIDEVKEK